MAELFIELFSEEIPAKLQIDARQKIKQKQLKKDYKKLKLNLTQASLFQHPKRLVFVIDGIPEKVEEKKKVLKGPKVGAPRSSD